MKVIQVLVCGLIVGVAASAHGQDPAWDRLELHDGRELVGSVREVRGGYEVARGLGSTWVPARDVRALHATHDPLDEVRRMKALGYAQGTAAERFTLARLHEAQRNRTEAKRMYLAVLRVDSDHAGARQALGYLRHNGQWLTFSERQIALGFVLHDGDWMTPLARSARLAEEARQRRIEAQRRADREQERALAAAAREAEDQREREVARLERAAAARATLAAPCPQPEPVVVYVAPRPQVVVPNRGRARSHGGDPWRGRQRHDDRSWNNGDRNRRRSEPAPRHQPTPQRPAAPQPPATQPSGLPVPRYAPLPPGVR